MIYLVQLVYEKKLDFWLLHICWYKASSIL